MNSAASGSRAASAARARATACRRGALENFAVRTAGRLGEIVYSAGDESEAAVVAEPNMALAKRFPEHELGDGEGRRGTRWR